PGLQRAPPESRAQLARGEPCAALIDEQRSLIDRRERVARREPVVQCLQRRSPDRHAAALAAFAEDTGGGVARVDPASSLGTRSNVAADQFADAQAAAGQPLDDAL